MQQVWIQPVSVMGKWSHPTKIQFAPRRGHLLFFWTAQYRKLLPAFDDHPTWRVWAQDDCAKDLLFRAPLQPVCRQVILPTPTRPDSEHKKQSQRSVLFPWRQQQPCLRNKSTGISLSTQSGSLRSTPWNQALKTSCLSEMWAQEAWVEKSGNRKMSVEYFNDQVIPVSYWTSVLLGSSGRWLRTSLRISYPHCAGRNPNCLFAVMDWTYLSLQNSYIGALAPLWWYLE